jgi:hypothetical protein
VDTSVPNVARMYDYYLGGKDNFEADRVAAEEIMQLVPVTRAEATEPLTPRTPEEVARLLDGFELIEPGILARYAQPHELGGAASESPVGWRVLARKP